MAPGEPRITELAGAILDGTPIDWSAIDAEDQQLLAALKLVGGVADFHRNLQREDEGAALEHWGHLRILERIGRGSFGDVYRAWDTRLDREVALKLLPALPAAGIGGRSIIHEGRLLARVRHPNVVAIYGAEQIGSRVGLWMEFVRGRTLDQVLRDGRTFTVAEIVEIGVELCRAVAAVHDASLLHRDIKAQNVALADDGRVVLMDFGSGRDFSEHPASDMTGTPLYLAPEILDGQPASVRSDVYSVGVLLYHLLTGRYPVTGDSLQELRTNHARGSRAPLQDQCPDLPKRIVSVVERALARNPAARYPSIQEMAAAFVALRARPAPNAPAHVLTWRAAAASAAAVVLLVWWAAPDAENKNAPNDRGSWVQLTRFGDSATAPALSRDGRMLTFIRGSNPFYGGGQIYLKEFPDGEAQPLTDDAGSKMSPVFSPDGSQIAYTTIDDSTFRWDTRIISTGGGPSPPRLLANASGLTWVDDRRFLFSQVKSGIHMALVTAADGAPTADDIYVPPHARGMVHRSALSPDGRWVLVAEMENQLWLPCRLLPFDGRNAGRPVGPPGAACMDAAWSPDGAWMYVSSNHGGNFHIWRQPFPEGEPMQLTAGPSDEHGIALTPDGGSLITSVGLTSSTLWITDARGGRQMSTESNPSLPGLGASAAIPRGRYFSPDRRKLYYLIKQSVGATFLDGQLWEADLDSGRTRAILPGFTVASYDVSADGKRVVFSASDENGRPRVWLAALDGATAPRPLSPANDDSPLFGPSGEVFFRRSENGANFLYRMHADGTGVQRLAGPVLAFHSVSPDGRWAVAYTPVESADVSVAVLAHPTAGGAPRLVCNQCKVSWSASGSHLYLSFPWDQGRTYVLAADPANSLPDLPAAGVRSPADLAALPVVRSIEGRATAPAGDGSVYASVRVSVQRNLFRIPLP